NQAFFNWNAFGVFAPFIPGFTPENLMVYRPNYSAYIYIQTANYFPNNPFSQYNSNYDRTQTAFYTLGGGQGGAAQWSINMRALIDDIHANTSNFKSYIGAGSQHCYIPYDDFYTLDTQDVVLSDWVSGITYDKPVDARVDCEPNCGTPALENNL